MLAGLTFNIISYGTGLAKKIEVVNFVKEDVGTFPVNINYIGHDDHFPAGDASWKYLFSWNGVNLSEESALVYQIKENALPVNDSDKAFGYIIVRKLYVN